MKLNSYIKICMNFIKKHIPLLLIILIPLMIEQKSLFSFACWLWVNPIAQHISGNNWISVLLIAIASYLYYEGFFHKKSKLILPALIVVIIILARTCSYWEFKSYYWTIPFLLLAIYTFSEITIKKKDKKTSKKDELRREGFVVSILDDIKSKLNPEHSYNYGLVGEWGSGKSFLMEMMYEKMKNEPKTFITYYFKPWETPNEKVFAIQILNGIKSNSENYELETKINKFLTKIETDSSDILSKTFTTFFSWLISDDSSIDDIKSDLSNYLKKNDKRLVVFLDDLDRLDQSEIKELLRLMRNTFDIPYLFFIVGYDRDYIYKTLGFEEFKFDNYISKFLQVKTNIPLLNKSDLFDKYRKEKILPILLKDTNNPEGIEENWKIIPENILELISTPRDFENIIASFDLSYRNLNKNCDWFTLFQLEVLKHKEYELYSRIRQNRSFLELDNKSLQQEKFTEHQCSLISRLKISFRFGEYKIQEIIYHHKYFSMVNGATEIDQNEFDRILSQKDLMIVDTKFEQWLENGKYDDLDRKLIYYFNKSNDYIDTDLLLLIDNKMASGPYSRHNIYIPILKYLLRILKPQNLPEAYYISEIQSKLDHDKDSRNISYYLVDHIYSVEWCNEIIGKFVSLIKNNRYHDNELFYFLQNVQIWLPNLIDKDIYSESSKNYAEFKSIFKEKINPILSQFAKSNIVEFLQNFSMPNIVNSSHAVYLIYDNLVPKLISFDDVLNLLVKENQTDSVKELVDFISKLKHISAHSKEGHSIFIRNFTFKYNIKIIDKS